MAESNFLNLKHLEASDEQKDGQTQQFQRDHTHFAKVTENAKGEPSVTVSIYGDDEYEVHDQVMGLYAMLKKSLAGGIKT